MRTSSLTALSREQLTLDRTSCGGRSASTVYGGDEHRWQEQTAAVPEPRRGVDDDPCARRGILYGAFTCPWSYLASQRSDLEHDPSLQLSWRMVDRHAPPATRLAAPGRRLDTPSTDRLTAELQAVRALLLPGEHLPAHAPTFLPHTGPAVIGYAEALGAGVGGPVRRLLFDAYWMHGLDIGLPDVLRRILDSPLRAGSSTVRPVREHGYAVTLTGGPITSDAHDRARTWHRTWLATGTRQLPALTVDAGTTRGRGALAALTAQLTTRPVAARP